MFTAAENLEFEKAARLRDELKVLEGTAPKTDEVFEPYAAKKKPAGPKGGGWKAAKRRSAKSKL